MAENGDRHSNADAGPARGMDKCLGGIAALNSNLTNAVQTDPDAGTVFGAAGDDTVRCINASAPPVKLRSLRKRIYQSRAELCGAEGVGLINENGLAYK